MTVQPRGKSSSKLVPFPRCLDRCNLSARDKTVNKNINANAKPVFRVAGNLDRTWTIFFNLFIYLFLFQWSSHLVLTFVSGGLPHLATQYAKNKNTSKDAMQQMHPRNIKHKNSIHIIQSFYKEGPLQNYVHCIYSASRGPHPPSSVTCWIQLHGVPRLEGSSMQSDKMHPASGCSSYLILTDGPMFCDKCL